MRLWNFATDGKQFFAASLSSLDLVRGARPARPAGQPAVVLTSPARWGASRAPHLQRALASGRLSLPSACLAGSLDFCVDFINGQTGSPVGLGGLLQGNLGLDRPNAAQC